MSTATAATEQVVAAAIREVAQIATLPEVTLKIVELVEDQTSTAQDLHKVIANDPALCSRILKVVNSSFYGLPGQIGSINRAIVLLGLNAVKNIAISASLAKLFKGGQLCPSFSAKDLWTHSVASATACKMLADELKMGVPDEAFLAGMIHDIGIMVEMQSDRAKLIEVVNQLGVSKEGVPVADMREVEKKVYSACHQDFGKALCEKWKFPASLTAAAGFHHTPADAPTSNRNIVALVHTADRLAGRLGEGFRLDLPSLDFDPGLLEELKLNENKVNDLVERLKEQVQEVEQLLLA